jgi:hypothetical protein
MYISEEAHRMQRIWLALGAMIGIALIAFSATAADAGGPKHAPAGTIAVASGSSLKLGGTVNFTYSAVNVKSPRIQVICSQGDLGVVYGEAYPAGQSFLLGGGGSLWKTGGGQATCVATLYYWDFTPSQIFNPVASVSFMAAGA